MNMPTTLTPDVTTTGTSKPWLAHYPACVPKKLEYPASPASHLLSQTAKRFPDRIACHYYDEQITYAELETRAQRFAAKLCELGVRPGDRVGLLLPNVPEYLIALNGIWKVGGIAVAISPLMVAAEISGLLATTDCRVLIALDMLTAPLTQSENQPEHLILTTLLNRLPWWQRFGYRLVKAKRTGWRTPDDDITRHEFADCVADGNSTEFNAHQEFSPDDPAYILPTGGTTGAPKAVVLSHRNLVANATQLHHWAGGRAAKDTLLAVLPFFHSYGLTTCALGGTVMAATLVMFHRFSARHVLKLVSRHQPSVFPTVPAMLIALNERLRKHPIYFKNLQHVISGGAPLPLEVAEEFADFTGATVVEGYGLSEASPVTHTGPLDRTNRPGTIGLPLPDTDARIVDAETGTVDMPPDEVGELIVRGPQVMREYWNNPLETAAVIRDGWLFTGDLAVRDADGFFRIVDRKKDLIITSGFNVYPTDVEQVLRECLGVTDVAIIGVKDAKRGEAVKALIVPDRKPVFDQDVFDAFCREKLGKHKRPRIVELIDGDLPRNFLGKVLRRHLRTPTAELTTADNATADAR
jgi:long-chain acyl-CoA synthetase